MSWKGPVLNWLLLRLRWPVLKYQENALKEVSRLQALVEDTERKMVEVAEEVATAKAVALSEYQSSVEFEQVCGENYDEGVRAFMYNVWREHPE